MLSIPLNWILIIRWSATRRRWCGLSVFLLCLLVALDWDSAAQPVRAAEPIPVLYAWQLEPTLDAHWWPYDTLQSIAIPPETFLSPRADQRQQAAQTVMRFPKHPNYDRPAMLQAIMQRLEQGEDSLAIRTDYFAAACELDEDGQFADRLWKLASTDILARPIVEQALIQWHKPLAVELWRSRLINPACTEQEFALACAGLGAVGDSEDVARLTAVVTDGTRSAGLRLVCARSIGRLSQESQLPLAKALRSSTALHGDRLAVMVLGSQKAPEIEPFMLDVAEHDSVLAQREAYRWLCSHSPEIARARALEFLKSDDAEIRRMSIEQFNQTEGPEAIPVLVRSLGDVHPKLRLLAREQLLIRAGRSAENDLAIKAIIGPGLADEGWQTREQCARLAVELDQTEHAPRLLELLEDSKPQVCITAAWALRYLGNDEKILQAMLEHAQLWTTKFKTLTITDPPIDEVDYRRVAHLLEALGKRQYEPAQPTLQMYVPKNLTMGLITRMAGIWACGKMWQNKNNQKLADQLCGRIADKLSMAPESESVRYTATLALGWIADPGTRDALVANDERKPNVIGFATEWALSRIDKP